MNTPENLPREPWTDGRIEIHPIGLEDVEAFHEAFAESWPSLRVWMNWGEEIHDRETARLYLESKLAEWKRG